MQISKPKETKTIYSQILQTYRYASLEKNTAVLPWLHPILLENRGKTACTRLPITKKLSFHWHYIVHDCFLFWKNEKIKKLPCYTRQFLLQLATQFWRRLMLSKQHSQWRSQHSLHWLIALLIRTPPPLLRTCGISNGPLQKWTKNEGISMGGSKF